MKYAEFTREKRFLDMVRDQKAEGSNPSAPTIFPYEPSQVIAWHFAASHSEKAAVD